MIEIADESSIRIGAAASRPDAGWILFFQSAYSRKPRLMRDESMRASPASMRSISSYFDISSENSSTGILWLQRRVHRDVDRPRRLAAARARRDDDQVLALQARRQLVQLGEAGRHAGHRASLGGAHLEVVQHLLHHVAGGGVGLAPVLLGDLEDLGLGLVEEGLELAEVAVGASTAPRRTSRSAAAASPSRAPCARSAGRSRPSARRWPGR